MKALHLTIVSPESQVFDGDVTRLTVPGTAGAFTILTRHAPIVSSLEPGPLTYVTTDGEEHTLQTHGGFVEMSDNQIAVCVD